MKKLFLTLCLVAVVIGGMNAGPVDQQKAQQLGAKFLGNPTNCLLNVNGNGLMHIVVSNLLGQKIMEVNAEGHTTLDLNGNESGIYLVRIENANGVKVQKISLQK